MPSEYDTEKERERKARQRERKRLAVKDVGQPWEGLMGEEREQAIREHWGYTASETRTQAEREQAAAQMLKKAGVEPGAAARRAVAVATQEQTAIHPSLRAAAAGTSSNGRCEFDTPAGVRCKSCGKLH